MTSTKRQARLAGLLYLGVAIGGAYSQVVRTTVRFPGNAAATLAAVQQHAGMVRAAFVADLLACACFLAVGLIMYAILKDVDQRVALAMVVLNAIGVAIETLNMLNHLGALLVATVPAYTAGMSTASKGGLVLLLLDMHQHGYIVAQVFFGGFLIPLGYLVSRSGLMPRGLGAILAVGGAGYLAGVVATYASPVLAPAGIALYFAMAGGLSETIFLLWLLVRGVKTESTGSALGKLSWQA